MSHQAAQEPGPRLEIEQRLDDTWATIRERLGAFVLVAMVSAVLVTSLALLVERTASGDGAVVPQDIDASLLVFAAALCVLIAQVLTMGVFFCIAYGEPSEAIRRLPDYAGWTLRRIVPFFGAGLIASLATGLGFLLLIVPGLWVMAALSLVPAVVLVEDGGFGSLRRSLELTKGRRWPIVGLLVLVLLAGLLANVLLMIGTALLPPVLQPFAGSFVSNLLMVLLCAVTIVIYRRLRWIETEWAAA